MKISKIHKFHRMKNLKARFCDYFLSRVSSLDSKIHNIYTFPDELEIYCVFCAKLYKSWCLARNHCAGNSRFNDQNRSRLTDSMSLNVAINFEKGNNGITIKN
jgi:hypothetical protein